MVSYTTQRGRIAALRRVGTWATWWWAASCGYLLLLVWQARNFYPAEGGFSIGGWTSAISQAFDKTVWLQLLLVTIIAVWIIGGLLWLRQLKRHKIRISEALADLFLTIRK